MSLESIPEREEFVESPEAIKIRADIRKLEALKDPDLDSVIAKKIGDLNRLKISNDTLNPALNRDQLAQFAFSESFWEALIDPEKPLSTPHTSIESIAVMISSTSLF
jgi:hypothetical protein